MSRAFFRELMYKERRSSMCAENNFIGQSSALWQDQSSCVLFHDVRGRHSLMVATTCVMRLPVCTYWFCDRRCRPFGTEYLSGGFATRSIRSNDVFAWTLPRNRVRSG